MDGEVTLRAGEAGCKTIICLGVCCVDLNAMARSLIDPANVREAIIACDTQKQWSLLHIDSREKKDNADTHRYWLQLMQFSIYPKPVADNEPSTRLIVSVIWLQSPYIGPNAFCTHSRLRVPRAFEYVHGRWFEIDLSALTATLAPPFDYCNNHI